MSQPWERQSYGPLLKGQLDRWQELPEDALFAKTARNVDFFQGVVSRRGGTQVVTGYGSYVRVEQNFSAVIPLMSVGVDDPLVRGFLVGDVVTFQNPTTGALQTRTITAVDYGARTISLDLTISVAQGTHVLVTRPMPNAVRGLFPVAFRDGVTQVVAASGGNWYTITPWGGPFPITEDYGVVPVAIWITPTQFAAGSPFTTFFSGVKAGDMIRIPGAGPGGADLVTTVTLVATPSSIINIADPYTTPALGTATIFLRKPDPSVEQFGVMFANVLHLSSGRIRTIDGGYSSVSYPPRKYEEYLGVIHRHGIIGPTAVGVFDGPFGPTKAPPAGSQLGLTGDFTYVFTYRNSRTGQESVISFPSNVVTATNETVTLTYWYSIDPQVDKIRIYRTPPGVGGATGTDYYFVAEVDNNPLGLTGFQYTDGTGNDVGARLARIGLDLQAPDETEQFIPWPHANRLIALVQEKAPGSDPITPQAPGRPGFLLISDQPDLSEGYLKGESFPTTNLLFVSHDDGDHYVSAAAFFDSVVVFKRRSIWRILDILPDIQVQPITFQANRTGVGLIAPKLIAQDKDELIFAHDDGFYQLSRFVGVQSGFVADRLSLPIDNYFSSTKYTDRIMGHATFFRPSRQLRAWPDFNAGIVFQFDGPLTGEPMGWASWDIVKDTLATTARITASCALPAVKGVTTDYDATSGNFVLPGAICLVGTEDGLVLQMDNGTADYGGARFTTDYETVDFAPAGRGVGARGRAIDFRFTPFTRGLGTAGDPSATPTLLMVQVATDQLATPGYVEMVVQLADGPALYDGGVSPFFLVRPQDIPLNVLGTLLIAPGQFHRLRVLDTALDTAWRLLAWDYWFQKITITQIRRAFLQTALERLT